MNQYAFFTEAREAFHKALLSDILRINNKGIPSNADKDSGQSVTIAKRIFEQLLGDKTSGKRLAGQISGNKFEMICSEFLRTTFIKLSHLRPGTYNIRRIGNLEIANYDQYRHLVHLDEATKKDRQLAASLGNDYLITPDVIMYREPEDDVGINRYEYLVDESSTRMTSIRSVNNGLSTLHATISCKWTIRSDRAQNSRSEALNLIRNRKGKLPHIIVVTAEPLPSRLVSIALGTGDIDCVYHFALPELVQAVQEEANDKNKKDLEAMVQGKRLRDISDLPLDLTV